MELFGTTDPALTMPGLVLPIQVRLYDPATSTPAAGESVQFSLAVATPPSAGTPDAAISEAMVLTGTEGVAFTELSTGTVSGVTYVVTATSPRADPVTLHVQVGEAPTGTLRVVFASEGDTPPARVRVLVLQDVYICDGFNPGAPPAAPLDQTVDYAQGSVELTLPESAYWVALLVGLDASGAVVAGGCSSNIHVVGQRTTEEAVTMRPVRLHLPGTYTLEETVDLSAVAPADLEALVAAVAATTADPPATLLVALKPSITQRIDAEDTECLALFEAELERVIAAEVPSESPLPALVDGLPARVAAALSAVRLEGTLSVTVAADGALRSAIAWAELGLACPEAAACRWTLEELAGLTYPVRLSDATTTFDAHVEGYDDVVVSTHGAVLEPGRLAAALVTDVALAGGPGGAGTFAAAALAFHDCAGIGAALSSDVTGCLSENQIAVEDVVAACEEAVTANVQPVTDILEAWAVPAVSVTVSGTARAVDEDQDLAVDRIVEGALAGTLVGGAAGAVTATFEATRL